MASPKAFELTAEAMGTEIVTIHVGPKRKAFAVHKKLICVRSEFFSKAFNGGFKEAGGLMYLPDDDVEAFELLINYIYQDRLPEFQHIKVVENSYQNDELDDYLDKIEPLFFLAEKFCINRLSNKILDAFQDCLAKHGRFLAPSSVIMVYKNTCEKSKLRQLYVLSLLWMMQNRDMGDVEGIQTLKISKTLSDFAADFVELQWRQGLRMQSRTFTSVFSRQEGKGLGRCFFHRHDKGEVCHLEGNGSGSK